MRTAVLPALRRDLGYAVRLLRRSPGFAIVAVATLAFGIGASTALFTVVNTVLLRPLPLAQPERLAMLQIDTGARLSGGYLDEWRRDSRTMADLAGWYDSRMTLTGPRQPIEVQVDRVTTNFFDVLGVPAILGRTFVHDRNLRQVRPEIVLSAGFWRRQYGAAPNILGQAVVLDGMPFTVVGVMPLTFRVHTNELAESRADVWVAFPLAGDDKVGMGGTLNVVGRLRRGATFEEAQADIALIANRLEAQYPSYSHQWHILVTPLSDATVKEVRQTLLVLAGAVAILLLIACANVANLMLGRATARRAEMAIRRSLGATSGRLIQQLLAESMLLAVIGGILGAVIGVLATRLILLALPPGLDLPRVAEIHVDLRVLAFAVCVTTLTALLSGLLPSIVSARIPPAAALRSSTRGVTSGAGSTRLHNLLIVAEVALALVLAAGAALLGRSFVTLTRVNPGFQPEHVVTMRATLSADRYASDDSRRVFATRLEERLAGIPAVTAVGWTNYLPLSQGGEADFFEIDGRPITREDERPSSWEAVVGGRYFDAMGIPLLRGRLPNRADTNRSEPVFVIDERLAHHYWPDANPVGQRLRWSHDNQPISGEIIGVVGSVHWIGIAVDPQETTYFWYPQRPVQALTVVSRVAADPGQAAGAISSAIREVDPAQPIADVRTLRDVVSGDLARPRFTTLLLGGFAAAALLLAALGLYGVIAYSVVQRRHEIGVRVALGAQRGNVIGLVMRRGLVLVAAGLALGLAGALALGREVAAMLYGVTATDVSSLTSAVLLLAAVGALAAYVPARRAAHVDPIVVLKGE